MQTLDYIFLYLTKTLYPTGRASRLASDTDIEKFHVGLIDSEKEVYEAALAVLDTILADNDNFTVDDAADWERRLAINASPTTPLEDRKAAIRRKYASPGDIPARQHYLYIEGQLQAAGFDVYVHENRRPDGMGGWETIPIGQVVGNNYGGFQYGQVQYGPSSTSLEKIANYIDKTQDASFVIPVDQRALFYIGGASLGDTATVQASREDEFRQLVLNLKPAQTVGLLLINYV